MCLKAWSYGICPKEPGSEFVKQKLKKKWIGIFLDTGKNGSWVFWIIGNLRSPFPCKNCCHSQHHMYHVEGWRPIGPEVCDRHRLDKCLIQQPLLALNELWLESCFSPWDFLRISYSLLSVLNSQLLVPHVTSRTHLTHRASALAESGLLEVKHY